MSKYFEIRTLSADKLREACITHKWYTQGTTDDYDNLFALLRNEDGSPAEMTTEKMVEIMEDIMAHSELYDDWMERVLILNALANISVTAFYL
jgi:hypothetical protein